MLIFIFVVVRGIRRASLLGSLRPLEGALARRSVAMEGSEGPVEASIRQKLTERFQVGTVHTWMLVWWHRTAD